MVKQFGLVVGGALAKHCHMYLKKLYTDSTSILDTFDLGINIH